MRRGALLAFSLFGLPCAGCGHPAEGVSASGPGDAGPGPLQEDGGGDDGACIAPPDAATPAMTGLVPLPVSVTPAGGTFAIASSSTIRVQPAAGEMIALGEYLGAKLRAPTGYALPVASGGAATCGRDLVLTTAGGDATLGSEGYELTIAADQVRLSAYEPAGIFRGLQTIRQLLPAAVESATPSAGPWTMATGTIRDAPRFAWRGAMLDVARHFFGVKDVETYIDLLAYYKINTLHLHLSDDQGWRIAIDAWPNLAAYGGSTEVGGGPGGYYTHADYTAIVAYAKSRYVTVVPEIDMPGHTTAALASYASLDCDGVAPPLDTGTTVGISSLCVGDSATYTFVGDVIREVAGLTPGPYLHVGGDEASVTPPADFQTFFAQVEPLVQAAGKQMVGWDAVGQLAALPPGTVVQYWAPNDAALVNDAIAKNAKVLMSPANKAYMDMKYDPSTPLGQIWAGYIDEQTAYTWDPAALVSGVGDPQIVGLEAPLWTETIVTLADVEYMAFPRIAGYAEIGWSPAAGRSWDEYKTRIGAHGPRLRALGVSFHQSGIIPWQ
jgi:hexosaminidase